MHNILWRLLWYIVEHHDDNKDTVPCDTSVNERRQEVLNNINPTLTLTTVLTIKFKKKDERITSTQF